MGKVIAGITMSLDGFVNDKDGSVEKLYPDFQELHDVPSFKEMIENTGAVVMGKKAYLMGDPNSWANDDYEFQVPIFVLTHRPPVTYPKGNEKLSFTFVTTGIESAISQAKQAAQDKDVQIIGGASTIQQSLNTGLVDELWIDIIPVLLGSGLPLFENIDTEKITFEKLGVEEMTSARTGMVLKVVSK